MADPFSVASNKQVSWDTRRAAEEEEIAMFAPDFSNHSKIKT